MKDFRNKIKNIYSLEYFSQRDTVIHRRHPMGKLLTTIVFIITVISYDSYSLGAMIPCIFYVTLVVALAEIPYKMIGKRLLVALPFCLFAGLSNLIVNRSPAYLLGGITITWGTISFFTI